jgi:predicted nucleic acid-binding protein
LRVALDTNVLAYAEGVSDAEKRNIALELIPRFPQEALIIPVQALDELFDVLVRKAGRPRAEARDSLLGWRDTFPAVETTSLVMMAAADLATDRHLTIWDAVVLAAASQAGCRYLLSEDLQDGFSWGGVTVLDPFVALRRALLNSLLGGTSE